MKQSIFIKKEDEMKKKFSLLLMLLISVSLLFALTSIRVSAQDLYDGSSIVFDGEYIEFYVGSDGMLTISIDNVDEEVGLALYYDEDGTDVIDTFYPSEPGEQFKYKVNQGMHSMEIIDGEKCSATISFKSKSVTEDDIAKYGRVLVDENGNEYELNTDGDKTVTLIKEEFDTEYWMRLDLAGSLELCPIEYYVSEEDLEYYHGEQLDEYYENFDAHTVEGYTITRIGDRAFANLSMKGLIIDEGVGLKYIGSQILSGCKNLEDVTFYGAEPEVADDAFKGLVFDIRYIKAYWNEDDLTDTYGGADKVNWKELIETTFELGKDMPFHFAGYDEKVTTYTTHYYAKGETANYGFSYFLVEYGYDPGYTGPRYKLVAWSTDKEGKNIVIKEDGSLSYEITEPVTFYAVYEEIPKPSKVANLKIENLKGTKVKASWSKSTGATKYKVTWKVGSKSQSKTVTNTSLTISGGILKEGQKVSVTVAAINDSGSSAGTSKTLTVDKEASKPAKVTNLKVANQKGTKIKVSWKKSTGATKYKVTWKVGKKSKSKTVTSTSLIINKGILKVGNKVIVTVTAVNSSGSSAGVSKTIKVNKK